MLDWTFVFFMFSIGIFSTLSMLLGGLAWLMFDQSVGLYVGGTCMFLGVIWTIACYREA